MRSATPNFFVIVGLVLAESYRPSTELSKGRVRALCAEPARVLIALDIRITAPSDTVAELVTLHSIGLSRSRPRQKTSQSVRLLEVRTHFGPAHRGGAERL